MSSGQLTVSLHAIAENYATLARKAAGAECAAVVKADAYGLGVGPVAKALWKAGARFFYVAQLEEALTLRGVLPKARIAVLNGLTAKDKKDQKHYQLISVMNHRGNLPGILHVDTGMNRLGFSVEEAAALEDIHCEGIMSHLACADTPEHPLNEAQYRAFNAIRKRFPTARASLANSAGIFLKKCFHFDQVRPGCALYGINPASALPCPVAPVVTLTAPILQIREITAAGTVGYGATAKVKKGTRLATIGLGYADGFLRQLSGKGEVEIGGKLVPLIGRVSMDLIIADISQLAANKQYTEATILGSHYDVNAMAKDAGTIGYEVLTRLGQRFTRRYA